MDPMWDRLSELHIPVGIIWGERDLRYGDIGQTLARAIPNSVPCEVRDSGHAIPLEQPRLLARAIESALEYMP